MAGTGKPMAPDTGPRMDDWAFRIIDGHGRELKIWANGQIEGFGPGCIVVNKIPQIIARAEQAATDIAYADCEPRS